MLKFIVKNLIEYDREHIWHPYSSVTNPLPVYPVKSAYGVRLKLYSGQTLIDGMSSWWAAVFGYNHPVLNRAVRRQLKKMSHVMFGGLTHKPAVALARRLIALAPKGLDKVFFADSGSVAVEVAMKMAVQAAEGHGRTEAKYFLTIRSGYHGDTLHAMSVSDPDTGMHSLFSGTLPKPFYAPSPVSRFGGDYFEEDFIRFRDVFIEHKDRIAGVILEPVVQGAGGMKFYHPGFLKQIRTLTSETGVILIFDEIATGFGRTGKMFACEHADVVPDILCLGKAITGGMMTFAAVLTGGLVASAVDRSKAGVMMHGPTFMANPLAASVSCAALKLLTKKNYLEKVKNIEMILQKELEPARCLNGVKDVRVLGAIGVIETTDPVDMKNITEMFVQEGIWIRPFGRLVYTMPPYIISDRDLKKLTRKMIFVLKRYLRSTSV